MRPSPLAPRLLVPLLAAAPAAAPAAAAQLATPAPPPCVARALPDDVPTVVLPPVDEARLRAEDEARGHWPLRYGAVVPVGLGLEDAGRWDLLPGGEAVWRLRLVSPGARTLGVTFDAFDLPPGGRVWLHDDARAEVLGAYTEANETPAGTLGVEPLGGDAVVVEYLQPRGTDARPRLSIGGVVHDYRGVRTLDPGEVGGGGGEGSTCLLDVNCPEGDPWDWVKPASVRTLSGGVLCSGAILNTTAADGTPYLLTAAHCGGMTSGVFLFNYEKPGCGTGSAPSSQSLSGATLLAKSDGLDPGVDSQLYRLASSIPGSFQPVYAGWDRTTPLTGGPAASIGHGGGAPKQVAVASGGAYASGDSWSVQWDAGMLVGGNSGGPLFNAAGRVVGPACCVTTFTCGSQTAFYGRFDRFWQLHDLGTWLDPLGLDPLWIDSAPAPPAPPAPTLAALAPATVASLQGGTVTLTGTDLDEASSVQVGGVTLLPPLGFTVVDEGTLTFQPPPAEALGGTPVSVVGPGGASNALELVYVPPDPPVLAAPALAFGELPFQWSLAGDPGLGWFLLVAVGDGTTAPVLGLDLLAAGSVLATGGLDADGLGGLGIVVPTGHAGTIVHSQGVLLDARTGTLVATGTVATQIVL